MKYKKLSQQQIIISIDRLTRFKPTEEKYLRVFSDIISSCLIEPKLKKKDILSLDYAKIRDIATEIFNSSLAEKNDDFFINDYLKEYENRLFENSDETQKLIENRLNYKSALKLVDRNTDVLNLIFLKNLDQKTNISESRKKHKFLYPVEKLVISEGITEEILLPAFADLCGYNFCENGVKIIAAGGKNQVVKLYYKLIENLKLPVFILLDKDAKSNGDMINKRLRKQDKIHLLKSGEFEDLLSKDLIVKTINREFKNFVSVKKSDLDTGMSMVKTLEELFKDKCLHEFKKAEFAQQVKSNIRTTKDLTEEITDIIESIKEY